MHGHGSLGYVVNKKASGSLNGEVDADSLGLFLLAMLGTVNTVGPTDSAYTHTFTLDATNIHDSLTITELNPLSVYQSVSGKRFPLAMIKRLRIVVDPNEFVRYSAEFVSKEGTP